MPDDHLDDALRSLAGHGERTGRLAAPADIRRRGDVRRRRRHASAAALGVVLVGLLTAGIAVGRPDGGPGPGPDLPADRSVSAGPPAATSAPAPAPPPSATPSAVTPPRPSEEAPPTAVDPAPADPTSAAPGRTSTPDPADLVLAGERQVAIVRVQGFTGALALTGDGRVAEVDDDSGRRLFVLVPLGGGGHLIRAAERDPGGEPSCWQARTNGSDPITVVGAGCSAGDPRQRFTVERRGDSEGRPAYAIANGDAFLQYSGRRGLFLEELGDATLTTTFRLVDNGAAPRSGG